MPLDVSTLEEAQAIARRLDGAAGWLKVGSQLFTAVGPAALSMAARHARVFLDTKFHDIPNTVASAIRAAALHGVGMLTVHASGGRAMLEAARRAADEVAASGTAAPLLLGVTVLTSVGPSELDEVGVEGELLDQVLRLGDLALEAGLDGLVASPREASALRSRFGSELFLVTPGIRLPDSDTHDDQSRTATPRAAIASGSDVLVVGRPVLEAPDPRAAAARILEAIEQAVGAS